jgi:hypothetical protein
MVHDNIFYKMGRSAIEFTNARNDADGNVYGSAPSFFGFSFSQPFLRVKFPEPAEWHNLESWREEHGWDKSGAMAEIIALLDPDKLELTISVKGDVKRAAAYKGIDADFFGRPVNGNRMPGPFADLSTESQESQPRSVDPR